MSNQHTDRRREELFQKMIVPMFAPVRHANLNGNRLWRFPAGTWIDEDGRPVTPSLNSNRGKATGAQVAKTERRSRNHHVIETLRDQKES